MRRRAFAFRKSEVRCRKSDNAAELGLGVPGGARLLKRYAKDFPLDDPSALDGDAGFIGTRTLGAVELLPVGYLSDAENIEFGDGAARVRRGISTPVWGRVGEDLLGAGDFRDPVSRKEWTLLAGVSSAWLCRPGEMPRAVGIPETDAASFTFCQAFDKVLAFRVDADGEPLAPWEWAGVGGFAPIGRESLGDGTQPIPFSAGAVALSDRIFVWGAGEEGGDFGWLSDIASLRFPLTARLRFNAGTDDRIVKGFAFNKDTVIVFKGRSIFRLSGVHGDLSEMVNERVNTRLGLLAPQSVASDGADVLFLSGEGVFRLSEVWENRVETPPVPVSYEIKPLMQTRIHWTAAAGAAAAVWDDRYFLAVPVDGSTVNNAVLVFDLASKSWAPIHTFAEGVQLDRLFVRTWLGRDRLFASDFAAGRLYLLYDGGEDSVMDAAPVAVSFTLTTRAFRCQSPGRKRFRLVHIGTEERHASYTVSILPDGVNEAQVLAPAPVTRSRTRNLDGTTWDATNADDDHGAPGREDYSVNLIPAMVLGSGIVLNRDQSFTERYISGARGRHARVTIAGTCRGALAIQSVQLEATQIDRSTATTY
jgi:hypothetical protein